MHPLADFCMQNNMPTRVVEVGLDVEFSLDDGRVNFKDEYENLGYGGESLKRFFEDLEHRDRGENTVVLELLFEMYKKILSIEQRLAQDKPALIPLDKKDRIMAIGHGMLWLGNGGFSVGEKYYLRFVLPSFSDKITAVFAEALSANVLRIIMMNPKDTQEFDLFIATREMEQIRHNREHTEKK